MIDLHMHTVHSDGTDTVEELLKIAEKKNLEVISITDHDTVSAYKELDNPNIRKLFSGKIIPGVEISTSYKKIFVEVLGYGIDYKKLQLPNLNQEENQKNTLAKLKSKGKELGFIFDENLCIDMDDTTKRYAGASFAREILKYPENQVIIEKIGNPFTHVTFFREHLSNPKSPLFIDETETKLSIEEVIDKIHKAGGLAFLAHPFMYPYEDKLKVIEEMLVNTELDGLECEYVEFTREQRNILIDIAKRNNKLVSGGTDYHHFTKPDIEMGTGKNNNMSIAREFIRDWENKVYSI